VDIPLNGGTSRFDYQSYDPQTHLLFIAHLGDSSVAVFDTETQKVVANISDVSKVHGVLAIPSLGRVYASATGSHQVVAIDEKSLQIVARIPGGVYPDGLAFAPEVHKLYVSDEHGDAEVVIDTQSNGRIATIALGGEAGNTQYDPSSQQVFVNVQTRGELVEIDPRTDKVTARYPLAGADGNHGLLIESSQRLAFVACQGNAKLLVVDMRMMRVTSTYSVGPSPDVLAFDQGLRLLYVASESGIVSVLKEQAMGLKLVGEGMVAPAAHSVAVVPETHRVYLPLQNIEGQPVLRVMEPTVQD
jgi:DNA-binding beta-propeller fold protein YncE